MSEISREMRIEMKSWLLVQRVLFRAKKREDIVKIIDAILSALDGPSEEERKKLSVHFDAHLSYKHNWKCPKCEKIHALILGNQGGAVTDKIVCLCGSTRFTEQMLIKQWELTKQGYVVLSWCALPEDYFSGEDKTHIGDQEGVKEIVDEVHFRKIELANEVLVINIGGYIGESTRNEIAYAKKLGKKITYLEPPGQPRAGEGVTIDGLIPGASQGSQAEAWGLPHHRGRERPG